MGPAGTWWDGREPGGARFGRSYCDLRAGPRENLVGRAIQPTWLHFARWTRSREGAPARKPAIGSANLRARARGACLGAKSGRWAGILRAQTRRLERKRADRPLTRRIDNRHAQDPHQAGGRAGRPAPARKSWWTGTELEIGSLCQHRRHNVSAGPATRPRSNPSRRAAWTRLAGVSGRYCCPRTGSTRLEDAEDADGGRLRTP